MSSLSSLVELELGNTRLLAAESITGVPSEIPNVAELFWGNQDCKYFDADLAIGVVINGEYIIAESFVDCDDDRVLAASPVFGDNVEFATAVELFLLRRDCICFDVIIAFADGLDLEWICGVAYIGAELFGVFDER